MHYFNYITSQQEISNTILYQGQEIPTVKFKKLDIYTWLIMSGPISPIITISIHSDIILFNRKN